MPLPRKAPVSLDATSYYHLICRCVERQFLCGLDALTERDFSHRRGWIVERIHLLGGVMAKEKLDGSLDECPEHCKTIG